MEERSLFLPESQGPAGLVPMYQEIIDNFCSFKLYTLTLEYWKLDDWNVRDYWI